MCFFRRDYERPELVVAPIDERRLQMFPILLVGIGIGAALVFLTGAMLTMPLLPTSRGHTDGHRPQARTVFFIALGAVVIMSVLAVLV